MASREDSGQTAVSSSALGLEALFTADAAERAVGDGSPELVRLRECLQGWLSQYEAAVLWAQGLLVWERPLHSIFAAFTLNTAFWLLSSTALRPLFLICVSLIGLVLLERWQHRLPTVTAQCAEMSVGDRESMTGQPRLLSVPELSHHLAESYFTFTLYVQEILAYKRQNHGKFCVLTCTVCLLLAVVGHYVPGVMISYIILLSVLLWPLVVYHELIQKMYTGLEPLLMKLDYSMKGGARHHKHDKRKVKKDSEEGEEPRAETESESEEEELSCFATTVDVKTTALAMAITDSELSDEEASILESGGFSVSRATTPQLSDVSEDLDQHGAISDPEEGFPRDLPDFPPVEEFPPAGHGALGPRSPSSADGGASEPQQGAPLSPASLLVQHLASPLHFVNTHFNGHGQAPGAALGLAEAPRHVSSSLEALSEDLVNTAISSVVQDTLTALLSSSEAPPSSSQVTTSPSVHGDNDTNPDADTRQPALIEACAEEEDFELLDQSELESPPEDQTPSPQGQDADTGVQAGHDDQQS